MKFNLFLILRKFLRSKDFSSLNGQENLTSQFREIGDSKNSSCPSVSQTFLEVQWPTHHGRKHEEIAPMVSIRLNCLTIHISIMSPWFFAYTDNRSSGTDSAKLSHSRARDHYSMHESEPFHMQRPISKWPMRRLRINLTKHMMCLYFYQIQPPPRQKASHVLQLVVTNSPLSYLAIAPVL